MKMKISSSRADSTTKNFSQAAKMEESSNGT